MLAASMPFEALASGELAGPAAERNHPPVSAAVSPERAAELDARYGFTRQAFGYRTN
jgi:hypothetical protein